MLDEGARAWLALIDEKKRRIDELKPQLLLATRRHERLKSEKAKRESALSVQTLEAELDEAQSYVHAETEDFFLKVFGIAKFGPCAKKNAAGDLVGGLCANDMTARLLSDGNAVFTVVGTSLDRDMHPGLPACDYLMAQQKLGETFSPL